MAQLLDSQSLPEEVRWQPKKESDTNPRPENSRNRIASSFRRLFEPQAKSDQVSFQEKIDAIIYKFEVQPGFEGAFQLLREIYDQGKYDAYGESVRNFKLLNELLDHSLDHTAQLALKLAQQKGVAPEQLSSLMKLIEHVKSFHDTRKALEIARKREEDEKIAGINFTSEYSSFGSDNLWIIYPEDVEREKVEKAKQKIMHTWGIFRESKDFQTLTILMVEAKKPANRIRSFATMEKNPTICLELFGNNFEEAAVHETVHAAFGAESNRPMSRDFEEGCATRLTNEILRKQIYTPHQREVRAMYRAFFEDNQEVRSHTQVLESIQINNPAEAAELRDPLPYAFGYILVDSLLANHKFQELQAEWKLQFPKSKKYSFLLMVNNLFHEEAKHISNFGKYSHRLLLTRVMMQRLGFSLRDFEGLIHQIKARVQKAAQTT